ncbi:MAG: NADH-quinone oxidoreductase subunit C [Clostridiales Family XIII bacterium]|jgi:ech hydrogenase subunit D|nr:NADH-quinone oxidoreductase subunit C [Clostridiales Family XIII bacterium]
MTERKDLITDIEAAAPAELLGTAGDAKTAGYRLGQICATLAGDTLEILYTFEKDNILKNYKFTIGAAAPELQSVTAIYPYAFIYENEMHDLFGVTFKNLALDYGGKFFKTAQATPWNPAFGKGGEN